jgi:hypothetical protein
MRRQLFRRDGERLGHTRGSCEKLPSEEASYIEKEYSAAIKSSAGTRIYDIEHRPFFPAWNLHNAFDDARATLKLSRPALRLKTKLLVASRIPLRMAHAKIAWDKFYDADSGNLLKPEQIRRSAETSEYMIGAPGLYLGCLANFIPDAH